VAVPKIKEGPFDRDREKHPAARPHLLNVEVATVRPIVDRADGVQHRGCGDHTHHWLDRYAPRFVPEDITVTNVDDPCVNAEVTPANPVHEGAEARDERGEARWHELHLLDVADERVLDCRTGDEDRPGRAVRVREPNHARIELVLDAFEDISDVELGFDPKASARLDRCHRLVVARDGEPDVALRYRDEVVQWGSVSTAAAGVVSPRSRKA
jgi:hypothetical protein